MFLLLGIITRHCYDIPLHSFSVMGRFTPDSAFQSAVLHISIPNTSNLSTPVIGSYELWCIPPGIIVEYWATMPFTSGHFWTLYKPVHTQNLGISAGLDNSKNITPQHPQHLFRLGSVCMVLDCCTQHLLGLLDFNKY